MPIEELINICLGEIDQQIKQEPEGFTYSDLSAEELVYVLDEAIIAMQEGRLDYRDGRWIDADGVYNCILDWEP